MTGPKARSVTEVGRGDYIKVGDQWKKIVSNSAAGAQSTPRNWVVRTEGGGEYSMWSINAYAKADDLNPKP